MAPNAPPTRWTPTTSSASSKPSLCLMPMAQQQRPPASRPSTIAAQGAMNAQAGVIATRPAAAPEAIPRGVGFPTRSRSTSSQPPAAAAVAIWVFMNARAAVPSAASSEPALKPNQPNHSRPAPSSTSGRLCGRIGSLPQPRRLPSTIASARPADPALTWTTVPPAKSSMPRLLSQPPPHTQWATGKYTSVAHATVNTVQAPNLVRSAIAPLISATVMTANVSWKAENTRSVIPDPREALPTSPCSPRYSNPPINQLPLPNVSESPYRTQAIVTVMMATHDII